MADQLQDIVQRMVAAGESEADIAAVIQHYPKAKQAAPEQPKQGFADRILADNVALPPMLRGAQALLRTAKANPVQAGAMAGGLLAAPLTGATSIPAAMAASGIGAGLGAGAGQVASGQRPDLKTMATEGALGLAGEGIGRGVAEGAKLAGRGLYRAGLLPINQILGKYGDVVKTGVENAVPVSAGGAKKAAGIRLARSAAKKDALTAADERVTFRAKGIADDAMSALDDKAISLDIAGEGDPSPAFHKRMDTFTAKNPDGALTPTRLERIKGTLDDRNGGAYQKMRKREPLTPREEARMALTHAASRAQETAIPGYRDMNKGIMDAVGLEKAIQRRTTGSGGNQGLENAMTMLGGLQTLPARLAMLPPVLSGAGIGAYQAGKVGGVPLSMALKTALIAALGGADDEQEQ